MPVKRRKLNRLTSSWLRACFAKTKLISHAKTMTQATNQAVFILFNYEKSNTVMSFVHFITYNKIGNFLRVLTKEISDIV